MATCIDPLSNLGAGLRTGSRIAGSPAGGKKQLPLPSGLQGTGEDFCLFKDSLIESGGKSQGNPWAAVGSLAFQTFLLAAVIIIPLFHTELLPKRELLTALYLQPPAAAAPSAPRLPAPTPAYAPTSIDSSIPVPKTQEVAPPPAATGGVVGGVPGGAVGGIYGGVFSEVSTRSLPVPASAPDPAPTKRVRLAARVAEANLVHEVAPKYPPEAGQARIEGAVVLMAVIGKDGCVQDVQVESGLPVLAQAAVDAVKQWRYKPYLLNGEPVEVASRITINFTLSRG